MNVQTRPRLRRQPQRTDSTIRPDAAALAGAVLSLGGGDWAYGRDLEPGTPLAMVVTAIRDDLTAFYSGEWTWVDGHTPACRSDHPPCRQALVRTEALRRLALPDPTGDLDPAGE